MAKKEECIVCKRAKMGGYAGEIKCTFYGRKPQFDETSCSNFVDAGEVVCNLDKPKPQSVPSKKSAADIINEHKQQDADLRDEIRKKYNIEGDISEEQYKQLCAIYKEEEKTTATSKVEKKKTKQTINKEAVWIIAIVLGLGIIFGGLFLWNNHIDRKNAEYRAEQVEQERIKQERIREEQERIKQRRIEEEQREKERIQREIAQREEQDKQKIMNALQGMWEWRGMLEVFPGQYKNCYSKLVVNGNYIVQYDDGDVSARGAMQIDLDEKKICYGSGNYYNCIDYRWDGDNIKLGDFKHNVHFYRTRY